MLRVVLVLLLGISSASRGDWGAVDIGDRYRPKTEWLERFSETPDVVAHGSINAAVDRCDEVVGNGRFCTVGIPGRVLTEAVEIFRSKTKLMGIDEVPLRARQPGTMIYIGENTRYVAIQGLELEGTAVGDDSLYGIMVEGERISYVAILDNRIHDFSVDNGDAHAIGVYGTGSSARQAITNLLIAGNDIHDLRTGSSEAVAINGNVARWQISNNDIYDINNIAIDVIGGEGTTPVRTGRGGRVLPGWYDAARYGYIEDNFVENMHTTDNPAYDNRESWAAAIYVDGGHHLQLRDNVVVNSAWAYEIGAENCVVSRHIVMSGNSAQGSHFGDLLLGGYSETGYRADRSIPCDPRVTGDGDEGHGYVRHLSIHENDFASDNVREQTILLQYRVTHAVIEEEGVEAVNAEGDGRVRGDENSVRTGRDDSGG